MDLFTYCAAVYLLYHVWNRSDLLAKPRDWTARHAPSWFTYASSCALCTTFWTSMGLVIVGFLSTDLITFLAAPVINLVLDLVVRERATRDRVGQDHH